VAVRKPEVEASARISPLLVRFGLQSDEGLPQQIASTKIYASHSCPFLP
jgi:hypothetical protein